MKIIRPKGIKDYFDYISIQYGIDPLLILKHKTELENVKIQSKSGYPIPSLNYVSNIHNPRTNAQIFYTVIVCGVPHVLEKRLIDLKKTIWGGEQAVYSTIVLTKDEFLSRFDKPNKNILDYAGCLEKYDERWFDIHKQCQYYYMILHSEVYDKVRDSYTLYLSKSLPLLSEFNFARIKPALQLHLEIQNFLAKMKNTEIPVQLSNEDLIEKHGFNKQSFRKRKHDN